jgi:protein phosphatase methylesterase 1
MASPLERKALRGGLPPRPPMMKPPGRVGGASGSARRSISATKDFSPLSWNQYFSESKDIRINEESSFRVYLKGEVGPVLLLLHGGGFSALTWSCYTASISYMVQCRCAALDLRGHGDTTTDDDANLSAETLSKDVADVVQKLYGDDPPAIVLMGHSMGGALAIHLAHKDLIPSLIGLIVIDVVEGTALEALSNMQTFLRGRPKSFESLERAIEWAVKTGHIRNQDSARVSMIGK